MSRNSPLYENGDLDSNLTLAIQESLKCAKQQDLSKPPELTCEKTVPEKEAETPDAQNETKSEKNDHQETTNLRELLLLHLDLIQTQQELLLKKDRELNSLKSEKEALKCRLERMERRMSLLKQKTDESSNCSPHIEQQHPASSPAVPPSGNNLNCDAKSSSKRKSSLEPQNLSKRFAATPKDKCTSSPREIQSNKRFLRKERLKEQLKRARQFKTIRHDTEPEPSEAGSIDSDVTLQSLKNCEVNLPNNLDLILRTDSLYHVQVVPENIEPESPGSKNKLPQHELEVPKWRLNPITNYYSLEGTENLEDEIFIKRHQKPEIDEKRRKRWDMQRLREQRMYEKLKSGRTGGKEDDDDKARAAKSFLHDPEDVEYIEVCDEVPVVAFGCPIPNLKPNEFQLPWFDVDDREKEEKKTVRGRKRII